MEGSDALIESAMAEHSTTRLGERETARKVAEWQEQFSIGRVGHSYCYAYGIPNNKTE